MYSEVNCQSGPDWNRVSKPPIANHTVWREKKTHLIDSTEWFLVLVGPQIKIFDLFLRSPDMLEIADGQLPCKIILLGVQMNGLKISRNYSLDSTQKQYIFL